MQNYEVSMSETAKVEELARKAALDAHKNHLSANIETYKPVFTFAVEGLKTLQLAHGGGLTAVLAFAGVRLNSNNPLQPEIRISILIFGIGLALTLAAWLFSWISQTQYTNSSKEFRFSYDHPYVHETVKSDRFEKYGNLWRIAAITSVILSFVLFCVGLLLLYISFR